MASSRRDRRPSHPGLLGPVAVVALLLGLPEMGHASAHPALKTGHGAAESHALHSCACGMGCREGACCCGEPASTPTHPEPSSPRPPVDQAPRGSAPCLAKAPCGQPGAPVPEPAWRGGKAAAAAAPLDLSAPIPGAPLEPAGPGPVPAPILDPLDKPPRPAATP